MTLRTGIPQRDVLMGVFKPDDTLSWILVNTEPIHDPATGALQAVVVSFNDVTARKAAEDALRDREERLQRVLHGANDGFWDWNVATGMEASLRVSLAEVKRHDAQMIALNRMNELLLSCENCEEAYEVIARNTGRLLGGSSGELAVSNGESSELRVVAAWGDAGQLPPFFSLRDCWGLRRGGLREVEPSRDEMDCRHFPARPPPSYLCMPLNVRSQTLGLLHVRVEETLSEQRFQELRTLTIPVNESIKLALSNLKLQQALRHRNSD